MELLARELDVSRESIRKKAVPHDPAIRGARKIVLRMRTHLDLFAHAFRKVKRAYLRARGALDRGYEAIGRFKDLFDANRAVLAKPDPASGELVRVHASRVGFEALERGGFVLARVDRRTGKLRPIAEPLEYPKTELEKRRTVILDWKAAIGHTLESDVPRLLARVGAPKKHSLKRKHLSRFFWGGVGISPKKDRSGIENLRRLARAMIDRALEELPGVNALETPIGAKNETRFHDFRKRLRAIWGVLDEFPEVCTDPGATKLLREGLFDLISRYGDVETLVVAVELANRQGKPKRDVAELERHADAEWRALKAFQRRSLEIVPLLSRLRSFL